MNPNCQRLSWGRQSDHMRSGSVDTVSRHWVATKIPEHHGKPDSTSTVLDGFAREKSRRTLNHSTVSDGFAREKSSRTSNQSTVYDGFASEKSIRTLNKGGVSVENLVTQVSVPAPSPSDRAGLPRPWPAETEGAKPNTTETHGLPRLQVLVQDAGPACKQVSEHPSEYGPSRCYAPGRVGKRLNSRCSAKRGGEEQEGKG